MMAHVIYLFSSFCIIQIAYTKLNLSEISPNYENSNKTTDGDKGLFPVILNLASEAKIWTNATCGQYGPETYCKLMEHVEKMPYDWISNRQCDVCDSNSSRANERHPIENVIDGTNRWWQSPSIAQGFHYNFVDIVIDLGQVYQVSYLIIKAATSPRPGNWILEKSLDGLNYRPWQYFALSDSECRRAYGLPSINAGFYAFTRDDEVICTTAYSNLMPLEDGEIHTSLVNGRPGIRGPSKSLIDFTSARYIRLRLQRIRTLSADLITLGNRIYKDALTRSFTQNPTIIGDSKPVVVPYPSAYSSFSLDQTVSRRYFYSIKDISIGGQCICYGHAKSCPIDPSTRTKKCKCEHNTCGTSCERCCRGYFQKLWQPSTIDEKFTCQPCNCHNHSRDCTYDANVERAKQSLDRNNEYDGGGVCLHCQHNTVGINCEKCMDGFYNPRGISMRNPDACSACDCSGPGVVSSICLKDIKDGRTIQGSGMEPGDCFCKHNFDGPKCEKCAPGFRNYPICEPCPCNIAGVVDPSNCEGNQCHCKKHVTGKYCDQCQKGYFNLKKGNAEGCHKCFCFGLSNTCTGFEWFVHKISTLRGWALTDTTGQIYFPVPALEKANGKSSTLSIASTQLPLSVGQYYWSAPPNFLGRRLLYSKGLALHYTVRYLNGQGTNGQKPVGNYYSNPDIVIEARNGLRIGYGRKYVKPRVKHSETIKVKHENWFLLRNRASSDSTDPTLWMLNDLEKPVSFRTFMNVLADAQRLLIRATFHSDQKVGFLESFIMEYADPTAPQHSDPQKLEKTSPDTKATQIAYSNVTINGGDELKLSHSGGDEFYYLMRKQRELDRVAQGLTRKHVVERCVCPGPGSGYSGLSCESCSPSFRRINNVRFNGTCGRCHCNSHSELCDPYTGKCLMCQHHTQGPNCERCKVGFYGDPTSERPDACKTCVCPLAKPHPSHIAECETSIYSDFQCTVCPPGHSGKRCEICLDGWYGDPLSTGEFCKPCNCHGNSQGVCNRLTGRCNSCKANTEGEHCELCQDGFYGWKDGGQGCTACDCNMYGSKVGECDKVTGNCQCKNKYVGQKCDACMPGYGNIMEGCVECKCHSIGSFDRECDAKSGQCVCKPGVTGLRCGRCLSGYYGLSDNGCDYCMCHEQGSNGTDCHAVTGQCRCIGHVKGRKCDECEAGFWGIHMDGMGCRPCRCNPTGSETTQCTSDRGECACKIGVEGEHCDKCAPGYYGLTANINGSGRSVVDGLSGCLKCAPCSKSQHVCDSLTGACTCPPNTMGSDCEKCAPYTWGYHSVKGCKSCNCNPIGSQFLNCSTTHGYCTCRAGYTGKLCDACIRGYFDFPRCRKCRCHGPGTKPESCHQIVANPTNSTAGQGGLNSFSGFTLLTGGFGISQNLALASAGPICDCENDGKCHCKTNVDGKTCKWCKKGSFTLDQSNPDGCTRCFCFGRSQLCEQAPYVWSKIGIGARSADKNRITLIFDREAKLTANQTGPSGSSSRGIVFDPTLGILNGYENGPGQARDSYMSWPGQMGASRGGRLSQNLYVVDLEHFVPEPLKTNDGVDNNVIGARDMSIITLQPPAPGQTLYWSLPNKFLGDKTLAYGANLSFTLESYPSLPHLSQTKLYQEPLVQLVGGNGLITLLYYPYLPPDSNVASQHSLDAQMIIPDSFKSDEQSIVTGKKEREPSNEEEYMFNFLFEKKETPIKLAKNTTSQWQQFETGPDEATFNSILSFESGKKKRSAPDVASGGAGVPFVVPLSPGPLWRWSQDPNSPVTRELIMTCLQSLDYVAIRATFDFGRGFQQELASISDLNMDVATLREMSSDGENYRMAEGIEFCSCPHAYTGLSCQNPAPGYFRSRSSASRGSALLRDEQLILGAAGRAEPCECNGHSTTCDGETGHCRDCGHNTYGLKCEFCEPGYYPSSQASSNNLTKSKISCKVCACPLTVASNKFSPTCHVEASKIVCDQCAQGYAGQNCELCSPGYYGDPKIIGGTCKMCQCEPQGSYDNLCHNATGQCNCYQGITGVNCDKCQPGHVVVHRGCQSCYHGCTEALMLDLDTLEHGLVAKNLTGIFPAPWGRLGRIKEHATFINGRLKSMGKSKMALSMMNNQVGSLSNIEGLMNDLQIKDIQLKKDILEALKNHEILHNETYETIQDVKAIKLSLKELVDKLMSFVTHTKTKVDTDRAASILLAKELLRNLSAINYDNERIIVGEEDYMSQNYLESLHLLMESKMDLSNYSKALDLVESMLKDMDLIMNENLGILGTDLEQMEIKNAEKLNDLKVDVLAIKELLNSTNSKLNQTNNLINRTQSFQQNLWDTSLEFASILTLTSSQLKNLSTVTNNLRNLNDRYEDEYVDTSESHSQELRERATLLQNLLNSSKHIYGRPIDALNQFKSVNLIVNNTSFDSSNVSQKLNDILNEVNEYLKNPENQPTTIFKQGQTIESQANVLISRNLSKMRELVGTLKHLSNSTAEGIVKASEQLIMLEQKKNFVQITDSSVGMAKSLDSLIRVDSIGAKVEAIKAKIDDSKFTTTSGHSSESTRQISNQIFQARSNMSLTQSNIFLLEDKLTELHSRKNKLEEGLQALRDQILMARQTASTIRVSLNSPKGDCGRTYALSDLSSRTVNEIHLVIRPRVLGLRGDMTLLDDSTLFYMGRPDGDALGLEIVGDRVRFAWRVGNASGVVLDPTSLSSANPTPTSDDVWFTIKAKRLGNTGSLKVYRTVEPEPEQYVNSQNSSNDLGFSRIHLENPARIHVGASQNETSILITKGNFDGCISELIVDGKRVGLWNFLEQKGTCSGCTESPKESREDLTYQFSGHMSYAVTRQISRYNPRRNSMTLQFKTYLEDALLFFMFNPAKGQYFAIELAGGRVLFSFSLNGKDVARMQTARLYNNGDWVSVSAERLSYRGHLKVDTEIVEASSPPYGTEELDFFDSRLFFGGLQPGIPLSKWNVTSKFFMGCMRLIQIGQGSIELLEGQIYGLEPGCKAKKVYTLGVSGSGFAEFNAKSLGANASLGLTFSTDQPDGLILLATTLKGDQVPGYDDHFYSVSMLDGKIKVMMGAGYGPLTLTSEGIFNDGQNHVLTIIKKHRDVVVKIDGDQVIGSGRIPVSNPENVQAQINNEQERQTNNLENERTRQLSLVRITSIGDSTTPNLEQIPFSTGEEGTGKSTFQNGGGLYLGGVPFELQATELVGSLTSYTGCLSDIIIANELFSLDSPVRFEGVDLGYCPYHVLQPQASHKQQEPESSLIKGLTSPTQLDDGTKQEPKNEDIDETREFGDDNEDSYDDFFVTTMPPPPPPPPFLTLPSTLFEEEEGGLKNESTRSQQKLLGLETESTTNSYVVNASKKLDDKRVIVGESDVNKSHGEIPKPAHKKFEFKDATLPAYNPKDNKEAIVAQNLSTACAPRWSNHSIEYNAVSFGETSNSHAKFRFKDIVMRRKLDIALEFRTFFSEGLLIYIMDTDQTEYLALQLRDTRFQVVYYTWGDKEILSPGGLNDGKWHKVRVRKERRKLTVSLDDYEPVMAPIVRTLNVVGPGFIGGVPESYIPRPNVKTQSFRGCIRNLVINEEPFDILESESFVGLSQCFAHIELGAHFTGDSYAIYEKNFNIGSEMDIMLDFRTTNQNGVLISIGEKKNGPSLGLALHEGQVIFSVNMGEGLGPFKTVKKFDSNYYVCDNKWHHITAVYIKNIITLKVDDFNVEFGFDEGTLQETKTNSFFYIGGFPDSVADNQGTVPTTQKFVGCMRNVIIKKSVKDWQNMYQLHNLNNNCPLPESLNVTSEI